MGNFYWNFHCVSFDNVGGTFVSFDTFLVLIYNIYILSAVHEVCV